PGRALRPRGLRLDGVVRQRAGRGGPARRPALRSAVLRHATAPLSPRPAPVSPLLPRYPRLTPPGRGSADRLGRRRGGPGRTARRPGRTPRAAAPPPPRQGGGGRPGAAPGRARAAVAAPRAAASVGRDSGPPPAASAEGAGSRPPREASAPGRPAVAGLPRQSSWAPAASAA